MEHRFSKKKSRRSRKKSTPLSSTTTSSSDSHNHTLTSNSTTTSDNYQDPYKKAQKSKISVPEGTKFDGYESDHVPTLPERCALTLSSFRPTPRKISRLSLPNSLTSTPPPSPASTTNSSTTTTSPSPLLDAEEVIKPKSLWNMNTSKKQMGVRYSLRSVIGDGTDQPDGPTVMDRRSLRPNGCHLNVSHWSADGLRPYMEDW